eukprot:TRINITY_DN2843_c0_g1_i2.p1 TRINITY_DN2843_c0_g1~~TRINITY_DN2843_c0_g1_i2.p1  ORF type:complete len:529 (+),score=60.64 TRINITY_DN2843_c0_g1_i2:29-1588(+)
MEKRKAAENGLVDVSVLAISFQVQTEKRISLQKDLVDRLEEKSKECQRVTNLVESLLQKPHHQVMVPMGKFALLSGEIVHCNDYMVKLGQDVVVHRSASQTVDILNRRKMKIDKQKVELEEQISKLQQRLQVMKSITGEEGLVEIQEEYDEQVHGDQQVSSQSPFTQPQDETQVTDKEAEEAKSSELITEDDFLKLMSRIEELEVEEKKQQEQQRNQTAKGRIEELMAGQSKDAQQIAAPTTPFMKSKPPIPKSPSSDQQKQAQENKDIQQIKPEPQAKAEQTQAQSQQPMPKSSNQQQQQPVKKTPPKRSSSKNWNSQNNNNNNKQERTQTYVVKQSSSKDWSSQSNKFDHPQQSQNNSTPKRSSSRDWSSQDNRHDSRQQGGKQAPVRRSSSKDWNSQDSKQDQQKRQTPYGQQSRKGEGKDSGFKKGFLKQQSDSKPKAKGGFSESVVEHKPSIHSVNEPISAELDRQQKVKNIAARWEITDSPQNGHGDASQRSNQSQKSKKSKFKQMMEGGAGS